MIRIEMHCHSSVSDGEFSLGILAEKLCQTGVKYAALTDHDSIAGLAHPLKTEPDYGRLCRIVSDLQEYGLDGIESIYASDAAEDRAKMLDLAMEKGLVISVGTDYHAGNAEAGIEVESTQWQDFRDAMMKISQRNADIQHGPAPRPQTRKTMKWLP